ncbi:Coenzyme F420 hydrogenase/dehydrogenase, beta subunit C-terminal domain, partial [Prevotella sp. 10(H)]|uniref:Coenzyme F420 hydrogenase/dehydrogenase, beta subunit C-terminal domain n=1 Tax=Prevotella sp. 10(H) TaxID=1158294 RepID=UPI0018CC6E49
VLFVGTPCQIGGLRKYLRKDYERLYTIDLVCHGVPSPLVFDKYKKWLEDTYKSKITEYNFRDKHKSWMWFNAKAVFESGDTYIGTWFADPFMRIFLRDFSLKDCCYNCQYTNMNRVGDLTIADFWGYKSTSSKDRNTDKGISLIIVNSQKGEAMFKKTEADLTSFKRDVEVISKGQRSFSMPFSRPEEADSYWNFLHTESFERVIAKYGYPQKRNIAQYALSEFGHNRLTGAIVWGYWKWRGIRRRIKRIF